MPWLQLQKLGLLIWQSLEDGLHL